MSLRIEKIGEEQQSVVVLDNAVANAQSLIDIAARLKFGAIAPYYPGIRAPAPQDYVQSLVAGLAPLIADVFGMKESALRPTASDFSLVTTPREELALIQRLPHYDGTDPNVLAVLHFLCGDSHGGTAFYRHRATGYETIEPRRYENYTKTLEEEVKRLGAPPARYVNNSTSQFERIAHFSASFNRMLIYRGVMLHSGDIPQEHSLSNDPRRGRLTVNTFITCAE